jgi:protein-tyrosine-phosphatase/DNA-binding transcriptional ArsR family regulator
MEKIMSDLDATRAFAALGHAGRLAVFRLLMRFAPRPVRPTEIATALDLRPSTLSSYLADLVAAGLVQVTRDGRSLHYAVAMAECEGLVRYLVEDCCRGRPAICSAHTPPMEAKMPDRVYNVLFICSGNSARSIFAEALLRDLGAGRFTAWSAGTRPGSALNPFAVDLLARNGHATEGLRAKHLSEFQAPDAPVMDFVFTVCDTAAAEECPPWPGQPITGHWGLPDPVQAQGTQAEKALAFARTYAALRHRIAAFVALPLSSLDRMAAQQAVDDLDRNALQEVL